MRSGGADILTCDFDRHLLAIPRRAPDRNRLAALQDRAVGEQRVGFHLSVQRADKNGRNGQQGQGRNGFWDHGIRIIRGDS